MKINFPAHGWLVTFKTLDDSPVGLELQLDDCTLTLPDDDQGAYSVNDWREMGLILPVWFPVDMLRRHPGILWIRRVWYLFENEIEAAPVGVILPEGELVAQCGMAFTMWFDRDAFLGAWAKGKGCNAVRILWEVYDGASGDIRRLAGEVLDGETGVLPILADALEEAAHPHAKSVRKMVKANPAPKPPKGYTMPTDPDPELTKAQGSVNGPCPGCGKVGRIAQRVKKTGPTKDRIFATCPGCSRIDWVGGADAAEPPAVPRKPRAKKRTSG